VAPNAQAKPACPTIVDPAGDTGIIFGPAVPDDAADITAVDVSSTKAALTVRMTIVGDLVNNDPVRSRLYEVYFDTGEISYVLRASLGNGETRYDLVGNTTTADPGAGAAAQHWGSIKSIRGETRQHTVTIIAPLDKDLPIGGRRLSVFGRTWMSFANEVSVGGSRTPQGVSATLDETETTNFRVGDAGCPTG
jgi:hypothetical protein